MPQARPRILSRNLGEKGTVVNDVKKQNKTSIYMVSAIRYHAKACHDRKQGQPTSFTRAMTTVRERFQCRCS